MDIEFQTFFDADGKEIQGVAKETFESTTSELNTQLEEVNKKLSNRELDIGNIKKKYSDLSDEEKEKMSAEKQEIMKTKEDLQIKLDQIENERNGEYKNNAFSGYSINDDDLVIARANFDRISLTEEEQKLPLKEQIELKTKYAINMSGFERPNVLNVSTNYNSKQEPASYPDTEEGIAMSAQMLGMSVEQYKEKNKIK